MEVRPKVQQRVERYVEDVRSGRIPSCRTITLAIKRWERDMANPDLYVDWDVLANFSEFAYEFKHYKGPLSGQPFLLEDWELFIAANVLSLKWKATGRRKDRQADIEVPRKNGKTFFVAVLALFLLLLVVPPGLLFHQSTPPFSLRYHAGSVPRTRSGSSISSNCSAFRFVFRT